MFRRSPVIAVALLLLTPLLASAQTERGNWELTLAGVGAADKDFNNSAIGVTGSLGYYVFDSFELSVRQSVAYVDTPDASAFNGATTFALDYHFPLGADHRFVPFIGGHVAYYYGDTVQDTFEYGPEAGIKYFLNTTTFVFFRTEYQFFEHGINGGSSDSNDQQWVFTLGIGVRF